MENWVAEEDIALMEAVRTYGTRWTVIQKSVLRERTVSSIRNRYMRLKCPIPGRNICTRCGRVKKSHICITSPTPVPPSMTLDQLDVMKPHPHPPVHHPPPPPVTLPNPSSATFVTHDTGNQTNMQSWFDLTAIDDISILHDMGFELDVLRDIPWWPFDTSLP